MEITTKKMSDKEVSQKLLAFDMGQLEDKRLEIELLLKDMRRHLEDLIKAKD